MLRIAQIVVLLGGLTSTAAAQTMGSGGSGGGSVTSPPPVDSLAVNDNAIRIGSYYRSDFYFDTTVILRPDTNLRGVYWYDLSQRNLAMYQNGGILGSFARELVWNAPQWQPQRLGYRQYELYAFDPDNNQHWQTDKPLTWVNFASGGNVQQHFGVFHTQNIGKTVNIGAEYRLNTSKGWYLRQETNSKALRVFASMVFPGNRWASFVNYTTYNQVDEQNGGVSLSNVFDTTVTFNPFSVPVNLTQADSRFNRRSFRIDQHYRIRGADSSFSGMTAFYGLGIDREFYRYEDAIPGAFYPAIIRDSSTTFDTLGDFRYQHRLGLRSENPFGKLQWELALLYRHGIVDRGYGRERYQLAALQGSVVYTLSEKWKSQLQVAYSPYNSLQAATHSLRLSSSYQINEGIRLQLTLENRLENADLIQERLQTNHYRYAQSLDGNGWSLAALRLELPLFWVAVQSVAFQNLSVYGLGLLPANSGAFGLQQVRYGTRTKLGKFHLEINHALQRSGDISLPVPTFSSHDLFYFENRFKTGWTLQLGFTLRYHSAFRAPVFRPELGQFVLQDSLRSGNYPVADVFAAIMVKRVRVFARFEHANQGFPAPNGFSTPLHPIYTRSFRFGVSWAFFN